MKVRIDRTDMLRLVSQAQVLESVCRITSICLVGVLLCGLADADWPLERGDVAGTAYATTDFSQEPNVRWRFEAKESGFEVTPIVSDGRVFIGDFDGTFYAIDSESGDLIWKKSFEDSGFLSAAAVSGGKVFVGDYNGMLRCLDAVDGELNWEFEAQGETYAGPNVVKGCVLAATEAGELLSLDAESGELKWKFEIDAPLRCWPTMIDDKVLLAGCDSRLHAVDFESGQEVESMELSGQTGSTPARHGDDVYFGTVTGTFYCVTDFQPKWTFQDDRRQETYSAATDGKRVVYSSKGKRIYALDLEDGEPLWDASVRTPLESAPIIAGKAVLFGTKRGNFIALDLETGERLWEYQAGGDFLAPAAVSGRLLLIANGDGTLYCFESETPPIESSTSDKRAEKIGN